MDFFTEEGKASAVMSHGGQCGERALFLWTFVWVYIQKCVQKSLFFAPKADKVKGLFYF